MVRTLLPSLRWETLEGSEKRGDTVKRITKMLCGESARGAKGRSSKSSKEAIAMTQVKDGAGKERGQGWWELCMRFQLFSFFLGGHIVGLHFPPSFKLGVAILALDNRI